MKKLIPAIIVSLLLIFAIRCAPARENKGENSASPSKSMSPAAEEIAVADQSANTDPASALSSSAAVENNSDTSRKFIRTADLRFRVADVIKTTYKIEDITKRNNGFVELSNLSSALAYEENKSLSPDSTLIITHYTVTNAMTLRVPNTKLDTTLKQLAPLVEFLDYRNIKATNVALDILSNRLTQQRNRKHEETISKVVDNQSGKAKDITSAAESILNSREMADQALISDLSLKDQISFSTITLQVYQRQSVKYTVTVNEKSIRAYEPGFWSKAWDALQTGFYVFKEFILFLIQIWWLILIGIALLLIYPRIRRRKMPVK